MGYDWTERAHQFGEEWRSARQFHEEWRRRWISWLAIASGGGIAVLLNFVANLPDPSFGLRALLVPFWAFVLSLVFVAIAAVLFGEFNLRLGLVLKAKRDQALDQAAQANARYGYNAPDEPLEDPNKHLKLAIVAEIGAFTAAAVGALMFLTGLIAPLVLAQSGTRFSPPASTAAVLPPCETGATTCKPWERLWTDQS